MARSPRSRSRSSAPAARCALALATAALCFGPAAAVPARAGEYAVVVSADVKVQSLTLPQVRQIFGLQRQFWSPGQNVVVLLPPENSPARGYLVERVFRANEGLLRRMLVEKMFRGEIDQAPRTVESDGEACALAAGGHGVVAIVPAGTSLPGGTRLVAVNGLRPGESGYPMRD
jgi:hypothetical protein